MVQRGGRAVFTTGPVRRAKLSPRRIQTSGCPLCSSNTGQNTREILVALKPHPLPKGAACATVGKPGLRCPAQEILVKERFQQCCGRRTMPLRWRQSCPHPAYLLLSPCLPSPAAPWSGASLQCGTAVPLPVLVQPTPAWAAWASLTELLPSPPLPRSRGKAVL